ncbi:flagellar basal body P-ring formation protein FlgA [bacterium]|nr:flagellar basal body P-ring formation protein FlgA [bacterium]
MKTQKIHIVILICLSALVVTADAQEVTVAAREYVIASGSEVLLTDIADIFGLNRRLAANLNSLFIAETPVNNEVYKINRNELRRRIEIGGFNLRDIAFQGSFETMVVSEDFACGGDYLKRIVEQYINSHYYNSGIVCEIEFKHLPNLDKLPEGNLEMKVIDKPNQDFAGIAVINVGIYDDFKLLKKLPVSVRIKTFQRALAAKTRIDRHSQILPANTTLKMVETTRTFGEPLTESAYSANIRTKRIINEGEIITSAMVEIPPLIETGDEVLLTVKAENLRITIPGRARQCGGEGDFIEVINIASKKLVTGQIIDENTVLVDLQGF